MVYLTQEEFKKNYKHYCWICKCYMSVPYEHRVVIGDLVVTIPLCFKHYNIINNNEIKVLRGV